MEIPGYKPEKADIINGVEDKKEREIRYELMNFNDQVSVKLNEEGIKMMEDYYNSFIGRAKTLGVNIDRKDLPECKPDENGDYKFQLSELAIIFGSTLENGVKPLFESMNIKAASGKELNLDDYVHVKLNSNGDRILYDFDRTVEFDARELGIPIDDMVRIGHDMLGRSRFQMHELMYIFGPFLRNQKEYPFDTTVFDVEKKL